MKSGEELPSPSPDQGCAVGVVRLNDFAQCLIVHPLGERGFWLFFKIYKYPGSWPGFSWRAVGRLGVCTRVFCRELLPSTELAVSQAAQATTERNIPRQEGFIYFFTFQIALQKCQEAVT